MYLENSTASINNILMSLREQMTSRVFLKKLFDDPSYYIKPQYSPNIFSAVNKQQELRNKILHWMCNSRRFAFYVGKLCLDFDYLITLVDIIKTHELEYSLEDFMGACYRDYSEQINSVNFMADPIEIKISDEEILQKVGLAKLKKIIESNNLALAINDFIDKDYLEIQTEIHKNNGIHIEEEPDLAEEDTNEACCCCTIL